MTTASDDLDLATVLSMPAGSDRDAAILAWWTAHQPDAADLAAAREHLQARWPTLLDDALQRAAAAERERDEARADATRLREALTDWCCHCWHGLGPRPTDARPAVVSLSWSDRRSRYCAEHLAEGIVNIALDHSYDRDGIAPDATDMYEKNSRLGLASPPRDLLASVERMCDAARAYLDETAPGWRDKTIELDDAQRAELLARCRTAGAGGGT